jgi:hypothetical protein
MIWESEVLPVPGGQFCLFRVGHKKSTIECDRPRSPCARADLDLKCDFDRRTRKAFVGAFARPKGFAETNEDLLIAHPKKGPLPSKQKDRHATYWKSNLSALAAN